jgi:phosphatidylserine decarboxylase
MAFKPESEHNEGIIVTFSCEYGDIEVTHRVGFFVRRIQNHIEIGEEVDRGYNYGKINFGSRVDIVIPLGISSKLKTNTRVYGGLTQIY